MTDEEKSLVIDNLDLVRNTIIGVISRNESVQGMGYDDLFQTGCEALCHAAMNYQAEKGASFRTFASLVIRNRLLSHCRIINRLQSPLQYLEEPLHDAEGTTLGDTLVCSATDTQKIEELDAQTLKFSSDFVKLNEITKEKEQTEQLLEEKMERWEYLEDLAAKIAGQQ